MLKILRDISWEKINKKINKKVPCFWYEAKGFCGAPRRTRTYDRPLRRRLLYPAELGVPVIGKKAPPWSFHSCLEREHGFEPRPEAWKAAVLPLHHSRKEFRVATWSGRQDSNLRPPGPKPGALPACATSRWATRSRSITYFFYLKRGELACAFGCCISGKGR